MQGGRKYCYILIMLINVTILITLFAFSYSAKYPAVEKTKCNIQNLYNAFTRADIQKIQQKDATLRSVFTNMTKFLPELMPKNYLQVAKNKNIGLQKSCIQELISRIPASSISVLDCQTFLGVSRNRRYQLLLQNCSHQMNTCIKYIIKLHADDCILDPSNHYIYYKRRKRIYRSTVQHDCQSEFLFKINTHKTHFIYLNDKLNLLFCEQIGFEVTYNVFHYRLKTQSCILRTRLSMPYATRLKRSLLKPGNGGTLLLIIIALVIGVPILITIISVIIIISIYCCCQENATMDDELPKSLIENCRQAEPPPEEQGKYLPELFDASAFQFKGPLIIEYPKLHILEHDLTNIKPDGSNVKDHVQFDENLNVAYNIGENVEKIVKSYGQGGTKGGSAEMMKDGEEEDEETTNEQENDSRQSVIENDKKEMAKYLKGKNIQSQEKKFEKKMGTKNVPDVKKKFKLIPDHTEKTQPSRYSESSTQTLRISGETSAENPAKHNGSDVLATRRERDFSIRSKFSTRKSKSLRKTVSNIPSGQISQAPMRLRTVMSINEQRGVPSIDATNITPIMRTTKSQQWKAEDTNPSVTGSTESEANAATCPKRCDRNKNGAPEKQKNTRKSKHILPTSSQI